MIASKLDRAAKFRKLQEIYLAELPGKIDQMRRQWEVAQDDNSASDAFGKLQKSTHNLAGSAGTFGYTSVTNIARVLEALIGQIESVGQCTQKTVDTISELIEEIGVLAQQPPQDMSIAFATPSVDKNSGSGARGQLVYIVEDDALLAKEICDQLMRYGYDVEIYAGTTELASALKNQVPAAMLIDLNLSEGRLSGSGFISSNMSLLKDIPVLFISSQDDWDARLSVARAGNSAYLTKPLDFNELLDRLELLTVGQNEDPYRVLLVDDDPVLAEHHALILAEAGMETKIVARMSELLPVISSFHPDLILMDIFMPECSGLEAAKVIRQKSELLSIPIVFLSTEANLKTQRDVLELGGDAFLKKPISQAHLLSSVATRVSRFRKLRSQMQQDALTGLFNHATIKVRLTSEVDRALRKNSPLVFAMLDIDHFKKVNDQYGHPAGDAVIKSISRLLKKRLRKSDVVGRYGGEEFAVVLPETTVHEAKKILDNLRQQFSEIIHGQGVSTFSCTFSGGIASVSSFGDAATLVDAADRALYKAKDSGRNRICEYDEKL